MRRNVPYLLTCKKQHLTVEMVQHYLNYLETRKKYASGETAGRTVELINQLMRRISKFYKVPL